MSFGRSHRAFRPSRMAGEESPEIVEEMEKNKQLNIRYYADRVRAGLPIFDPETKLPDNIAFSK